MWKFVDGTPMIELRIRNVMREREYPEGGGVMAVVDTGFSGFLFIPRRLFDRLGFGELRTKNSKATLADGRRIEITGAYGSVEFPQLATMTDGLVETSAGASEILVGMDGIRQLNLRVNCCAEMLEVERCYQAAGTLAQR